MLRAAFDAELSVRVVTLDPVGGAVAEEFTLIYGPPEAEEEIGVAVDDDVAFEPIVGTVIDAGEAVSQQFALALPPFPRIPGASVEPRRRWKTIRSVADALRGAGGRRVSRWWPGRLAG